MVGVDTRGRTIFWSRRAQSLFGWEATQVLGEIPPIVPLPLHQEWQLQMQRVLRTGEPTPAAETQRVLAAMALLFLSCAPPRPLRGPGGEVIGVLDTLDGHLPAQAARR